MKPIKKTKEETMHKLKESIISNKNVNKDIEESARNVKNSDKVVEVVKNMGNIIRSNKCSILWLAYQQDQIFERFKVNNKFINMMNQFGISKLTMVFKIPIVRFLNNYPKNEEIFTFSSLFKE